MIEQNPELEAFSKFIVAIEPWLGEVVLVGGWAHRLYRLDPRARKLDYLPLTTLDGDVAVPPKLKKEESTVRKRLLEAGFEEEFIGEDRPPATHYHYGKGGGFYAEFLAPLEGSGWHFFPTASLHRHFAALALEGRARRERWICAVTKTDGADS